MDIEDAIQLEKIKELLSLECAMESLVEQLTQNIYLKSVSIVHIM